MVLMISDVNPEEIDYDKLIEYELCHLNECDVFEESQEDNILQSNINENDSFDAVLEKISKSHEEFYKMCFDNITLDDETVNNEHNSSDVIDEKTKNILASNNLTYENFVEILSNIKNDYENEINANDSVEENLEIKTDVESPFRDLINHEKNMGEINEKKWNEYEKFYREYDERCKSARSISQKELQEEANIEKLQRQEKQNRLNEQLKCLEEKMKLEEEENKVRLREIELEIQEEKQSLMKLQNESKEIINVKLNWAAITIQKNFRKYRIRKRVGPQIDEARTNARRKLFNTKLIINEKKAQKQKAVEIRKWRKEKEKNKEQNDINIKILKDDLKTKTTLETCEINTNNPSVNKQVINNSPITVTKKLKNKNTKHLIELSEINDSNLESLNENENIISTFLNSDKFIVNHEPVVETIENSNNVVLINENDCQSEMLHEDDDVIETLNVEDENIMKMLSMQNNNSNSNFSDVEIIEPNSFHKIPSSDTFRESKENLSEIVHVKAENKNLQLSNPKEINSKLNNEVLSTDFTETNNHAVNKIEDNIHSNINRSLICSNVINFEKNNSFLDKHELETVKSTNNQIFVSLNENIDNNTAYQDINTSPSIIINQDENVINTELDFQSNFEINNSVTNSLILIDEVINDYENKVICNSNRNFTNIQKEFINDSINIILTEKNNYEIVNFGETKINDLENTAISGSIFVNLCKSKVESENEGSKIKNENVSFDKSNSKTESKHDINKENKDNVVENNCLTNENQKIDQLSDIVNNYQLNDKIETNNLTNKETVTPYEIDEEYIKIMFPLNTKIVFICLEWIRQIINERNCTNTNETSDVIESVVPILPKHFRDDSSFNFNYSENTVTMIPNNNLPETCKSLSIIKSQINSINNFKNRFPVVEHLVLNESKINAFHMNDLPESIRFININHNQIEWAYFGQNIESRLTVLSCSSNELCDLPMNAFKNCHHIVHIDLSNNNFTNIDSIFKGNECLTSLCSLNLNNNVLSNIDYLDKYCRNLTNLSISGNHIKNWSKFNKFPFLVYCDISHNSLISLETWANTPLLVTLNVSYNSISDIESFQYSWMPCLATLNLDSNKLQDIPEFCFLSLQTLSLQRNFISNSVKSEPIFKNCPLLSSINLKDNFGFDIVQTRNFKGEDFQSANHIVCPDGEFSTTCYDFSDSIQQKSDRFRNILKSSSDLELIFKHQVHYYRFLRETVEDFTLWMDNKLFCNDKKNILQQEICLTDAHINSVIKIQSLWRGYRTRKWYKNILSYIKLDTEKCFDEFNFDDVSEYDKTDLINNWNSNVENTLKLTNAWIEPPKQSKNDLSKYESKGLIDSDNDEIIIPGNDSTYRSNNSASMLSRKGMELMKEWGFEDPNSALWIMQRAKKFQRKPEKSAKRQVINFPTKPTLPLPKNIESIQHKAGHGLQKTSQNVAQLNTVIIQPPDNSYYTSYKSKIDEWLSDTSFQSVPSAINSDKKSFLPAIESEHTIKKLMNLPRSKTSATKLPSINSVSGNV